MKILAREKCGRAFVPDSPLICNSDSQIESLDQRESVNTNFLQTNLFLAHANDLQEQGGYARVSFIRRTTPNCQD